MADDRTRLRKIASNLSEEDRVKQLSAAKDVRRDIEETLGYDIVNQEALIKLAESIWLNVPMNQRGRYTAEDWQRAIHDRCSNALMKAEQVRGNFIIAKYYEKTKRWAGAVVYYNEVLQLDPNSSYAALARQQIEILKPRLQPAGN